MKELSLDKQEKQQNLLLKILKHLSLDKFDIDNSNDDPVDETTASATFPVAVPLVQSLSEEENCSVTPDCTLQNSLRVKIMGLVQEPRPVFLKVQTHQTWKLANPTPVYTTFAVSGQDNHKVNHSDSQYIGVLE